MRISKKQLKKIIKEELMRESGYKVGDAVKVASSGLEGEITELFPADGQWGETAVVSLSSGEEAEFELTDLEPLMKEVEESPEMHDDETKTILKDLVSKMQNKFNVSEEDALEAISKMLRYMEK